MKKILGLFLAALLLLSCLPALAESEETVVTVATWQNSILMEEMLERFNATHPGIKAVTHELNGGWFDHTALLEAAASGSMPDVFVITTPEIPVSNGWMMDLTPYLEAETEKTWYDATIMKYDGKTYILPYSIYFYGVIVNKTLLNELNIPIPGYDWTVDEFFSIIEQASKPGYYGINGSDAIITHIAPQLNPETGWALINTNLQEYNLDDTFIEVVNRTKEVRDRGYAIDTVGAGLEGDEYAAKCQEVLGTDSVYNAYLQGKVALTPDFSWSLSLDTADGFGGWDWDFYPLPVSEKGNRTRSGIVADGAGILATTANPDAAFEVLKWITYSPEGYQARLEIAESYDKDEMMAKYPQYTEDKFEAKLGMADLPGCFTAETIQAWSAINQPKPGAAYAIAGIPYGYVDGYKCVPGWSPSQWDILWPTINNELLTGNKAAADIAVELKEKCDAAVAEAYAAMGIDLSK